MFTGLHLSLEKIVYKQGWIYVFKKPIMFKASVIDSSIFNM